MINMTEPIARSGSGITGLVPDTKVSGSSKSSGTKAHQIPDVRPGAQYQTLSLTIDMALMNELRKIAQVTQGNVGNLVRDALQEFVKQQKAQLAAKAAKKASAAPKLSSEKVVSLSTTTSKIG